MGQAELEGLFSQYYTLRTQERNDMGYIEILKDDPYVSWEGELVEFRLTYQGLLLAESQKGSVQDARATHKQEIRKRFHPQLRNLWGLHPYLKKARSVPASGGGVTPFGTPRVDYTVPKLAQRFSRFGYNFVPLVIRDMDLLCSVDILFLRSDPPGSVLSAGDIDNRLKTLFDGLIVPRELSQVGEYTAPTEDEDPFYCLLEDDSLITKVSVETDTLLAPVSHPANPADARVVVTVRIKPSSGRYDTLGYS